jgi:hypothetical protein
MRNWAWARKGGGAKNSCHVRSVAVETVVMVAAVAGKTTATTGPAVTSGEGAAAIATLSFRLLFGLDIVQVSPQHGIDACIDIFEPDFSRQHTAAAGMAVAKRTNATAMAAPSCFAIDVPFGCTVS